MDVAWIFGWDTLAGSGRGAARSGGRARVVGGVGLGSLRALGVVRIGLVQTLSGHALEVIHLVVECQGKLFTFSDLAQTPKYFWSIHVHCK